MAKVTIIKTWSTVCTIDVPDSLDSIETIETQEWLDENYDKVATVAMDGINEDIVSWVGTEAQMPNGEYITDWLNQN